MTSVGDVGELGHAGVVLECPITAGRRVRVPITSE
jgi:hypothetical protein